MNKIKAFWMNGFLGKVAVITGAGSGTGRALAISLPSRAVISLILKLTQSQRPINDQF